jgi:hypothetical protein
MKLVLLVDSSNGSYAKMAEMINDKDTLLVDTEDCDEPHERKKLFDSIKAFTHSSKEIMLAKISGRESIIRELGDECPEMILSLSFNKHSRHYSANPIQTFQNLINTFEREH